MTASNQTTETIEIQGTRVPRLGFGTWQIEGSDATGAVRDALEIGYRQIDTARAYGNEAEVGAGIAGSGVDREDIFLMTKLFPGDFEPDAVKAAAEDSLRSLRTEYLDLLLLHWLERALEHAPVFCDQVEYHPFLGQDRLLELGRAGDVLVTAYSPLAHGRVPGDATLTEIGETHGKSAGQVALRWLLDQPGVSPIPKASSHTRRVENIEVFEFALSDEERERIDALPK